MTQVNKTAYFRLGNKQKFTKIYIQIYYFYYNQNIYFNKNKHKCVKVLSEAMNVLKMTMMSFFA